MINDLTQFTLYVLILLVLIVPTGMGGVAKDGPSLLHSWRCSLLSWWWCMVLSRPVIRC
jgi:hypothetical protein